MSEMGQPRRLVTPGLASWCLYDWGNSVFSAVIIGFVFGPYFVQQVAADPVAGTALWGNAISLSAIAIAVLSPVAGAFCDKGGRRKVWLGSFSALAILATAPMWWIAPTADHVLLALVLVVTANVGFELSYVFYNAMLPGLVPAKALGRASGWGWGVGYFGSLASMAVVWTLFVDPDPPLLAWLDRDEFEHIRVTAPFSALWFLVFVIPLFIFVPGDPGTGLGARRVLKEGIGELLRTLRSLPQHPSIAWYLLAHMLYIDGLNTLFVFGPIFAATVFGLTEREVLLFGLFIYIAAGAGSLVFAWVDDWIGGRRVIALSLIALAALCGALLLTTSQELFWPLGAALGVFIGPVQAASRSLMARLAPEQLETQMFGLYALAGRVTAPLGPALVGWCTTLFDNTRAGMAVIVALFAVGLVLLALVREPRSVATA